MLDYYSPAIIDRIIDALQLLLNLLEQIKRDLYRKVLVCTVPYRSLRRYHNPVSPCRHVRAPDNYQVMPQWEARRHGLMACPDCRWESTTGLPSQGT